MPARHLTAGASVISKQTLAQQSLAQTLGLDQLCSAQTQPIRADPRKSLQQKPIKALSHYSQ